MMTLFFKVLSRLPLGALYFISDIFSFVVRDLIRYRRDIVIKNLKNSFPDKDDKELKSIAVQFYSNLTDFLVETLKALTISQSELKKRVVHKNKAVLEKYIMAGQSFIILTLHHGNWEWMQLSGGYEFSCSVDAVYKTLSNRSFDKLIFSIRSRFGGRPVAMENVVREITGRKGVRAFAMVADQRPGPGAKQYWAQFFGQDTPFMLGPEQLPKFTKLPVIFMHMKKKARGYYNVYAEVLAEPPYDKDSHVILDRYIARCEQVIREDPSGWLWSHNRWKYFKP